MGRLLELIFPEREYQRKKKEAEQLETKARIEGYGVVLDSLTEKVDGLRSLFVRTEAIRNKREKEKENRLNRLDEKLEGSQTIELLQKLLNRIDEIDKRLDAIERKIENSAAKGRPSDEVSAKQILSEYLFGENGDE